MSRDMTLKNRAANREVDRRTDAVPGAGHLDRLRAQWTRLATREKNLVILAAALVAGAIVFLLGIAPAVRTLRTADAQHARVDASLSHMAALSNRAVTLQRQPRVDPVQAAKALRESMTVLGDSASLSITGARATLTLKGTPPGALTGWLMQARAQAHATPLEAQLTQRADGETWNGVMILGLPER